MGSNLSMVAECKATIIGFERFLLFSFDLKFVLIVFIDENPLSHSAVLAGRERIRSIKLRRLGNWSPYRLFSCVQVAYFSVLDQPSS